MRRAARPESLLAWLRRAALAYDDWWQANVAVPEISSPGARWTPDCQEISVTLAAAAIGHDVVAHCGSVCMREDRDRERGYHWWLTVEGRRFDPKGYVLAQRYALPRAYSRYAGELEDSDDPDCAFEAEALARPFTSLEEAAGYSAEGLPVEYILEKCGPPPVRQRLSRRRS